MSSSPRRAPAAAPHLSPAGLTGVVPFFYDEVGSRAARGRGEADSLGAPGGGAESAGRESLEREMQARESGRQQGVAEAGKKFEEQLARERAAIASAVAGFARERENYYRRIEEEAIQLALGIARKILHREAQVDPLLLLGVAKVAMEKIEGATEVKLAVNPQRAGNWKRHLSALADSSSAPEIVEDPALPLDQCELRTSMGVAQFGVELQLKEIEQGLMDLLAARPQGNP
jgi:flagellar assembly protein FliH